MTLHHGRMIYNRKGTHLTVLPEKEWLSANTMQEGKTIPYNDFINNVSNANYYDANHVIITLNETQIDDLVTKYEVKI